MKIQTLQGQTTQYEQPEYTVLSSSVHWQYFCLKLSCFFAWLRPYPDPDMVCPKCGETDDVVGRGV